MVKQFTFFLGKEADLLKDEDLDYHGYFGLKTKFNAVNICS